MTQPARRRRWPWFLAALAVLLAIGGWWVDRQLEPERLAATVLARAAEATGLDWRIEGRPDYALRPEPRLVLPGLDVRFPGAATPLLRADRLEVSLPWDTLLGGDRVVVTRLDLERPRLDLAALSDWLDRQPEGETAWPEFSRGLGITDGELLSPDWRLSGLSLETAHLAPGQPLSLRAGGLLALEGQSLRFDATLAVAELLARDAATRLQLEGRWIRDGLETPFRLQAEARPDWDQAGWRLPLDRLALTADSPLPSLDVSGHLASGEILSLDLSGRLLGWPADWPALPEPLAGAPEFTLATAYAGGHDFDGVLSLRLALPADDDTQATRLDSKLRWPQVRAWLDDDRGNPLPPLQGQLQAPSLAMDGVVLEGVRLQLGDEETAEAAE